MGSPLTAIRKTHTRKQSSRESLPRKDVILLLLGSIVGMFSGLATGYFQGKYQYDQFIYGRKLEEVKELSQGANKTLSELILLAKDMSDFCKLTERDLDNLLEDEQARSKFLAKLEKFKEEEEWEQLRKRYRVEFSWHIPFIAGLLTDGEYSEANLKFDGSPEVDTTSQEFNKKLDSLEKQMDALNVQTITREESKDANKKIVLDFMKLAQTEFSEIREEFVSIQTRLNYWLSERLREIKK